MRCGPSSERPGSCARKSRSSSRAYCLGLRIKSSRYGGAMRCDRSFAPFQPGRRRSDGSPCTAVFRLLLLAERRSSRLPEPKLCACGWMNYLHVRRSMMRSPKPSGSARLCRGRKPLSRGQPGTPCSPTLKATSPDLPDRAIAIRRPDGSLAPFQAAVGRGRSAPSRYDHPCGISAAIPPRPLGPSLSP
jgi:hypothetical protein